jgi:hypothetical protein
MILPLRDYELNIHFLLNEFWFLNLKLINSNSTPLQQQQETAAAALQDPYSRQQPF